MARIVVAGYMVRFPLAGNLFAFFHYVLGLSLLGHEVTYIEESGWPNSCYIPATREFSDNPAGGIKAVQALINEHCPAVPVIYVNRIERTISGTTPAGLRELLRSADLFLNIGGVCWLPEFELCRRRAFIDMDPLFTQAGLFGSKELNNYQLHFSYGANIGRTGCSIPSLDLHWLPTVPPVVSVLWDPGANNLKASAVAGDTFTTIANWKSYKDVSNFTYNGITYGQKEEEFLRLLNLPRRTSQKLELALSGADEKTIACFQDAGWQVRDAGELSEDTTLYSDYIKGSRGEFSVAKNGYVATRSGWFSDRSVCYLAAGLPVVLQDTGFGDWLPTGQGVLAFSSLEEAAVCLTEVNSNYQEHRLAARRIAEAVFDYRVSLGRLLELSLGDHSTANEHYDRGGMFTPQ